jgi:autophagy-related protein 17
VRWIGGVAEEQFKLAAELAKTVEKRRAVVDAQVQEWDIHRKQRADALDAVLEALSTQHVPPEFHTAPAASEVFGEQISEEEDILTSEPAADNWEELATRSPTTLRGEKGKAERARWKTLRDFVDERGIEEVIERMEDDRATLEDLVSSIAGFTDAITDSTTAIRASLPTSPKEASVQSITDMLDSQESTARLMAGHLETLAEHYGKMAAVLRDSEAGEIFSEEDLQDMNTDAEHLPSIIIELEKGVAHIEDLYQRLLKAHSDATSCVNAHQRVMDELDDLGDAMGLMLERVQVVETESETQLLALHDYLFTLESLQSRFGAYQHAYNRLVIEMDRRRHYQQASERIIATMASELDALVVEERGLREAFKNEHGDHLPNDLCLSIENAPTRWALIPVPFEANPDDPGLKRGEREVLPDIDLELLIEARERVSHVSDGLLVNGSTASLSYT